MRELPKIAREKLAAGPAPGAHLDANLIAAFTEHSLLPRERTSVIAHMAVCEQCRTEVQVVLSAAQAETRGAVALSDDTPEARPESQGAWWRRRSWQQLLRWQPITALLAVAAISFAFWAATRRTVPRDAYPAAAKLAPAPVMTASNTAPVDPAAGAAETARRQSPAPSGEAKQKRILARDLSNSQGGAANPKPQVLNGPGGKASSEVAGQLISGDARPRVARGAEAVQPEVVVAVAPPPPKPAGIPVPAPPVTPASSPAATQPVVQDAAASHGAEAPARGVQPAPAVMSLQGNFAAKSPMRLRKAAQRGLEPAVRWAVGADATAGAVNQGAVERSLDDGRSWEQVPVAEGVTFRVVFALGNDVWAGGSAGAFFHSSDSGQHWSAVPLAQGAATGGAVAGDIVSIEFADAAHGVVSTSSGARWITSDGGQTWQQAQ